MVLAVLALTADTGILVATVAQVVLALLVAVAGIHISKLLHDAVPSTVRSGVTSGVSAISWMVFLPVALGFGLVSEQHGVRAAGLLLVALTAAAGLMLVALALRPPVEGR
jgi:hypothetical protein